MRRIRIGHSPDADDAFMFYALAKGKIPSGDFEIEHVIEDIETLNRRALRLEPYQNASLLEVTALSCHAFAHVSDFYRLIPYGASVGEGYGPVLIAKDPLACPSRPKGTGVGVKKQSIRRARIAVPGRYTTAYLVLQIYEKDFEPVFTPFDQIFDALEKGRADLGLLIHEGQLTYQDRGFQKIVDLGEWWKEEFKLPLPLGINAIRCDLGESAIESFTRIFKASLDYAMAHREEAMRYALQFGRGIDFRKGDRFVGMYVNEYSLAMGEKGMAGLRLLFRLGFEKKLLPSLLRIEPLPLSISDQGTFLIRK